MTRTFSSGVSYELRPVPSFKNFSLIWSSRVCLGISNTFAASVTFISLLVTASMTNFIVSGSHLHGSFLILFFKVILMFVWLFESFVFGVQSLISIFYIRNSSLIILNNVKSFQNTLFHLGKNNSFIKSWKRFRRKLLNSFRNFINWICKKFKIFKKKNNRKNNWFQIISY